jgi:hypothetical protein
MHIRIFEELTLLSTNKLSSSKTHYNAKNASINVMWQLGCKKF